MSSLHLAIYLGTAALYALLGSFFGLGLLRRAGRRPQCAERALLWLTLFFVALAFTPFPARNALDCAGAWPMQLQPFHFAGSFQRLWRQGAPLSSWMGSLTVSSTLMNFALCAAIGLALAGVAGHWLRALAFGVGLSFGIEITQLTGLWRIYPCAYRLFDVDDLMLNISGVMAGYALARGLARLGTRAFSPSPDRR